MMKSKIGKIGVNNMATRNNGGSGLPAVYARIDQLEARISEQQGIIMRIAGTLSQIMAQQMQPQLQQNIYQQLISQPEPEQMVPPQPEQQEQVAVLPEGT